MRAVVDASAFGQVILRQGASDLADRIGAFIASRRLVQPAHWPLELTGITLRAARDKQLPLEDREQMRDQLSELIRAADVDAFIPATAVFDVVIRHSVSVYDAPYLELAIRRNLPLLTMDAGLAKAAAHAGVELIELS
jgi:predicted nucleic acid-binding protein